MGMLGAGGETVDTPSRRNEPTVTDRPVERDIRDEVPGLGASDVPFLSVGDLGYVSQPVVHTVSVT